jgi:hypothetical protein
MAKLILTEEEKEERSYLNWSDEALGKYVKKKAIEHEDYYGDEISEREAAVITLLSRVRQTESDMVMMEVQGVSVGEEDIGNWRITFEKTDPDVPDGPSDIDPDNLPGGDDESGGEGGVLVP